MKAAKIVWNHKERATFERELKRRFGATVAAFRAAKKMTQLALAEKAGTHRSYVADVERGFRNVAITNAGRLIRALGLKPAEFYNAMERMP